MSHVACHLSCVLYHISLFFPLFLTKWWSLLVEGLLSSRPTPSSLSGIYIFFMKKLLSANIRGIWVHFLRTGIGSELCDFFKMFGWLLWPNVKKNNCFVNWLGEIFFTKVLGKKYGSLWHHITTLHYTTLHYTTLHYTTLHYTTLNTTLHFKKKTSFSTLYKRCSTTKRPLINQSMQTEVVSPLF